MAIKYRASWNTSGDESLIQFDFIKDRGCKWLGSSLDASQRHVATGRKTG